MTWQTEVARSWPPKTHAEFDVNNGDKAKREELLASGWEPFAVLPDNLYPDARQIWFRKEASEECN